MYRWAIYYQDRALARVIGDPCLGVVEAEEKTTAEQRGQSLARRPMDVVAVRLRPSCDGCGRPTANALVTRYYNEADPTEPTVRRLCDTCLEPRETPEDYGAAFADEEE